ncbi:hypothetical protein GOP47_0027049 [Adiantum capillus-veneris]|nr:hypothetical protein GOP47_0027049 [Adiantum capillus-veneris]
MTSTMKAYHNPKLNLQNSSKVFECEGPTILGGLIHATHTRFVKERSIHKNIFTFWEATVLACIWCEELMILQLDFQKAYDHVDWSFREGTMLRMGFSEA